eukprot:jgi/Ulvmu1/3164/UM015_0204.1
MKANCVVAGASCVADAAIVVHTLTCICLTTLHTVSTQNLIEAVSKQCNHVKQRSSVPATHAVTKNCDQRAHMADLQPGLDCAAGSRQHCAHLQACKSSCFRSRRCLIETQIGIARDHGEHGLGSRHMRIPWQCWLCKHCYFTLPPW